MKRLWQRWLDWTQRRAERLARLDQAVYGTGYVVRAWWGFKHVDPYSVYIDSSQARRETRK